MQYYDDAAGILRSIILSAIAPHRLATAPPQQLVQSPSQEERACHDFDRQATEELPNFLPYAAVDNTDELEERCSLVACNAFRACCYYATHLPVDKQEQWWRAEEHTQATEGCTLP